MADDASKRLFLVRLALGLGQGLLLYFLYHAQEAKSWPATNGLVFGPLLLVGLFIPLLLNQALGEMAARRAMLWALVATAAMAALGLYDIWSAWPKTFAGGPQILPSVRLLLFCAAGLFIAHALVVGAAIDRRFQASYSTHFDVAWKQAVQLALTAAFVGTFWLLLVLGANLFALIRLEFFSRLLRHEWFSIPVTALAVAGALHLTDIRPALVRGVRTLGLTLLSWLLPLLTLIVTGFLLCLPITGLKPLWAVGHASILLLAAAAVLVVLINAAHQDGDAEYLPPRILRWSGTLAAVLPLPLGAIAIYALYLRVTQYGWTEDRVLMAAALTVAGFHALGYARAAVTRGPWLQRIEGWNFHASLLTLGMIVLLSTPLADPRRIAVNDQMARLEHGKVKPEAFDYQYLRWQGGRYGRLALESLTHDKMAGVAEMARGTLQQTNRYIPAPASPEAFIARLTVYPKGQTLPASFIAMDWSKSKSVFERPDCADTVVAHCDAILADVDGDGRFEILLMQNGVVAVQVFGDDGKGVWRRTGMLMLPFRCPAAADALRQGHFTVTPPTHQWYDVTIAGQVLHISNTTETQTAPACPGSSASERATHVGFVGIAQ